MEEQKDKKLLTIGGLTVSFNVIKNAKEMGLHTIVVDAKTDGPTYQLADESVQISSTKRLR